MDSTRPSPRLPVLRTRGPYLIHHRYQAAAFTDERVVASYMYSSRVGTGSKQTLPTSPATLLGADPIQSFHFVELAVGVVAAIIVRVTAIGQGSSSTACQSQCP